MSIGQAACSHPELIDGFERFGLDYFSPGDRSIAQACDAAGADRTDVQEWIDSTVAVLEQRWRLDWTRMSLTTLCDEIENTHHIRERQLWERVDPLLPRIFAMHGRRTEYVVQLAGLVTELRTGKGKHQQREEGVCFPLLRYFDHELGIAGAAGMPGADLSRWFSHTRAAVAEVVGHLTTEHDAMSATFASIRQLTNAYQQRVEMCASHAMLMHLLSELDRDSRLHMHRENHILFPAAIRAVRTAEERAGAEPGPRGSDTDPAGARGREVARGCEAAAVGPEAVAVAAATEPGRPCPAPGA